MLETLTVKNIAIIAAIALGAAFIIFIVVKIIKWKKKADDFLREVGGVKAVAKAISEIDPKDLKLDPEPKSVSGMTSLLLPRISNDFPEFVYSEQKRRAENVLTTYLEAVDAKNDKILSEGNDELRQALQDRIRNLRNEEKKEHFEQIKLHRTEIYRYDKTPGRCLIKFQISVGYIHYIENSEQKLLSGNKETVEESRYNVDMVYIQDRDLLDSNDVGIGFNCPNCGAPLTKLGAKKCPYCGTPVEEINIRAWQFNSVEEG